jgi:hypothetical protein
MPSELTTRLKMRVYLNLNKIEEDVRLWHTLDDAHEALAAIKVLRSFASLVGSDTLDAKVKRTFDHIEGLIYGQPR